MSYEILEHTADAKFRATGETIEDAFSESVKAFSEVVGAEPEAGNIRHSINIESENQESLFFDFLDELIFLQDTEGVVVTHVDSLEIDDSGDSLVLEAVLWTDTITGDMTLLDIKAPTYNEMKVDYVKGEGWVLETVLDI